ncbi:MAG: ABC transporter transmembrane domain-containing protein, partial [Paludibacteraceae bacterium]|nr:ABC transporter transmembrane domain-containing protein [Paludibacteraceae bacterium]
MATLFSIFSFAVLIPILQILFKTEHTVYEFQPWTLDSIKNNCYYFVQQYIEHNGGISTLLLLSVVLIFMTLLKTGTTYLASYFIIPMRTGLVRDIRRDMYAKIVDLNLGFYDKQKKGDIMARMLSDVGEVEASIMSSIELLSKNPIMIVFYLGVMLMLSWELTLFVLLVLPIAGFLMGRIGRSLKRKSVVGQEQQGSLTSIIEETLNGLRIIKAFNA